MGNRICRARRNTVEERFTRPQRLVRQPSNVDYKKLRKLIISEKLAPCFDGVEDCPSSNSDLEECPICFFFYPSLNRSRCCSKGICTECFLQMNPSNAIRPAQCPFCKTSSYAVEYRGAKTQEEKGLEQAEEQKVIEAKIRMQFEESQSTDQIMPTNQNSYPVDVQSLTENSTEHPNGWVQDVSNSGLSLHAGGIEVARSPFLNAWNERHAEFGLDLEEIMLMEAIWQSIQDPTTHSSELNGMGGHQTEIYNPNQSISYVATMDQEACPSLDSITGGVAVAIARMAERNIVRAGAFHSTQEDDQSNRTPEENSVEHHDPMLSTITHGAGVRQMEHVQSVEDHEIDEARSEHDCLASSSATEEDSLDSLSAYIPEVNHGSEDGFTSDENLLMEDVIDNTSSFSSLHTISDESRGSPNCPDFYGSPDCSLLPDPISAVRFQRAFAQSHS